MDELRGIIHVGANTGQEAKDYAARGLNVLWIEPIPEYYDLLKRNIEPYPKQEALNYLVGDADNIPTKFNVSDNHGLSSSIMNMAGHSEMYPWVHFNGAIECPMWTLDSIIEREGIDLTDYDGLVVDVQGAELKVLNGASNVLQAVRWVQIESANFELYAGYPKAEELTAVCSSFGLKEKEQKIFDQWRRSKKKCFNIIYERKGPGPSDNIQSARLYRQGNAVNKGL